MFTNLVDDEKDGAYLVYGATLTMPFDPNALTMCPNSGRMYHPITTRGFMGDALVECHLAMSLAECFVDDVGDVQGEGPADNAMAHMAWKGVLYQVTVRTG